ncbi:MAG: response regulator [Spirochaetales bacterium]|nr:response regulator [Spirochaetales bacterium]
MSYNVLIVEDDPMVAMINSQYVAKNPDFVVAGNCRNGQEAITFLQENSVDLVLLDVYMPVMTGTETLKKIRELKIAVEVIMVTAANDTQTIEETVHLGVLDYLIKPFNFERFNVSLEKFAAKKSLLKENPVMDQNCVDSLISNSAAAVQGKVQDSSSSEEDGKKTLSINSLLGKETLPKGIQRKTLLLIESYLNKNTEWNTVDMISDAIGISIVTVRTYMNYLVQKKIIKEDINYSTGGRPSILYKVNK